MKAHAKRGVRGTVVAVVAAACIPLLWTAGAAPALAQHETAADVLDGERAYARSCLTCHGPDGDLIAGIGLMRGRFRRQMSDDDLVQIIRTGIPNTPMPPSTMTVEQARQIVAYLRSRAETLLADAVAGGAVQGDAARGAALFTGRGGCTGCHRVAGVGSGVGPELTGIGAVRSAREIAQSLVDPAAVVEPSHRFYRVVLQDGSTVSGRLLSHDSFTVQLLDTSERLRSFSKDGLREHGFVESPMPSFRDRLTEQDLADVVSYLVSLKGA